MHNEGIMNLPLPCQWPCNSYFCVQGS